MRMTKKKYSIIIPVYNSEKFLKKCIESITRQTYKNIEIILINDGSTDNSKNIIETYAKRDTRIRSIDIPNNGVSNARNLGVREANGDYITFVDADDYIDLNTVEKVDSIIEEFSPDVVKYNYITELGNIRKKYNFSIRTSKLIKKESYDKDVYPFLFSSYDMTNVWNAFIKSEIAKQYLFDRNLKYGEDSKYMFEILKESDSLYIIEDNLYHYVQNIQSVMNVTNYEKKIIQLENKVSMYLYIYSKIDNLEENNRQLRDVIRNSFMECLSYDESIKSYESYKVSIEALFENKSIKENIEFLSMKLKESFHDNLLDSYKLFKKKRRIIKIKGMIKKVIYSIF